jgi:hypothetical protein
VDVANVPVPELGAGQDAPFDLRRLPGATIAGTVMGLSGAPLIVGLGLFFELPIALDVVPHSVLRRI